MPRRDDGLLVELTHAPWWMSVIVAGIFFVGLKFVLPALLKGPLFSGIAQLFSSWALVGACVLLLPGVLSAFNAWRKGQLLKSQKSLSSLLNLSWREFEEVIGEIYREHGYRVTENAGPGADGGVDLVARKEGETVLIQCKHWKSRKVGVATVREMFGLWNAERATNVHIITCGDFTEEARQFARGKPVKLIHGASLLQLINKEHLSAPKTNSQTGARIMCPQCGSGMVIRTAKKGKHAGEQFWGCERFPVCKGIRATQN